MSTTTQQRPTAPTRGSRSGNPIVMAGGIIASIPVLILFLLAQRYVVEGVARSGLK